MHDPCIIAWGHHWVESEQTAQKSKRHEELDLHFLLVRAGGTLRCTKKFGGTHRDAEKKLAAREGSWVIAYYHSQQAGKL